MITVNGQIGTVIDGSTGHHIVAINLKINDQDIKVRHVLSPNATDIQQWTALKYRVDELIRMIDRMFLYKDKGFLMADDRNQSED